MNMAKWVADTIASPAKKGFPVLSFPAIQKMDVAVKDLIGSADLQAEAMRLVAESTPSAASVSFMDLSVEAECVRQPDGVQRRRGSRRSWARWSARTPTWMRSPCPRPRTGGAGLYVDAVRKAVRASSGTGPCSRVTIGPFSAGRPPHAA